MYKNKKLLNKYLKDYLDEPYAKKTLVNMKRFEDMYKVNLGGSLSPLRFIARSIKDDKKALRVEYYLEREKKLIKSFEATEGKTLILTTRGENVLFKKYPLQKLREEGWDKRWTLVSYDIKSNSKRDLLRRTLKRYGFGTYHQSLMVSPLKLGEGIYQFLESERYSNEVNVFRCENLFGLSNIDIAASAFNIDELNKLYEDLYFAYEKTDENVKKLEKWKNYFLAVNYFDPYLPYELLPGDWMGDECITLYKKKGRSIFDKINKLYKNSSKKINRY